jgi:uncharacterized protein
MASIARRFAIITAALVLAATAAPAQTISLTPQPPVSRPLPDFAYGAYQQGFYRRAMLEATRRLQGDANDAAAMVLVAELHRQGLGTRRDLTEAASWYRLAHLRGERNATYSLALMTLRGDGIPRDEARGRELLTQAAVLGVPAAQHDLALLLLGTGQPADAAEAVRLLDLAAKADLAEAQHALAVLLTEGRGAPADLPRAAELLRKAAAVFHEPSEIALAIMMFNGQGIEKDEIGAADLFTRAALRGNAIAQNRLARIFASGRGRTRDGVEAAAWHLVATAQGRADPELDPLLRQLSPEDREAATTLAGKRMSASLSQNLTSLFQ